jgi:beta-lactamase superfamily II metal-dependent hydrolase
MPTKLAPMAAVDGESRSKGLYHFLDVGDAKYGECTLVEFGEIRILIDGSHQQDFVGQRGHASIPAQLRSILGPPPHDITLLVVTHCHADHVGCLPELVSHGVVRPRFALLTDPRMGFGRTQDHDALSGDALAPANMLAALLREEDATDLTDEELDRFIEDAITVESRYARFVRDLTYKGVDVSFHLGGPLKKALADALKPTGATLLGPNESQILYCAEQISTTNKEAEDAAAISDKLDRGSLAELYRQIVGTGDDAIRNPRGNGMNCQSITFAFGPPDARVLLAGDMQFSDPGVRGADREVAALRRAVVQAGPYKLFKTTHHTSHNGQDAEFLEEIGDPELIVHSGGLKDESHPYPRLLSMLSQRRGITFARTDRNGVITVDPTRDGPAAFRISEGRLNDFTPNLRPDEELPAKELLPAGSLPDPGRGPQIIIVNLPPGPIDVSVGGVDIVVRQRSEQSRQELRGTFGTGVTGLRLQEVDVRVAPGRELSGLLFVTDPDKLAANIGRSEARRALQAIEASNAGLVTGAGPTLADKSRESIAKARGIDGVVLLGGYDVTPTRRRDVLGSTLRTELGKRVAKDGDQFLVWSDASYADLDGDALAEYPVSRIPDGRDAGLFLSALEAQPVLPRERFGIHNIARPFAKEVWSNLIGSREMNPCEHFSPGDIGSDDFGAPWHYLMLHGSDDDGTIFVGETETGEGYPTAITVDSIPVVFNGIVFSGCCWGALIADRKAVLAASDSPPPRLPENSIALSYLKAGASAFVGCTGSHYSGPSVDPDENYAYRLHEAFWRHLPKVNGSAAKALFEAKQEYAQAIVDRPGPLDPLDTARRLKNLAQFTCLGLGW